MTLSLDWPLAEIDSGLGRFLGWVHRPSAKSSGDINPDCAGPARAPTRIADHPKDRIWLFDRADSSASGTLQQWSRHHYQTVPFASNTRLLSRKWSLDFTARAVLEFVGLMLFSHVNLPSLGAPGNQATRNRTFSLNLPSHLCRSNLAQFNNAKRIVCFNIHFRQISRRISSYNFLTDLDHLLAANGVDPVFNMVLGDHDEVYGRWNEPRYPSAHRLSGGGQNLATKTPIL